MKAILIVILFSTWDGHYMESKPIAGFKTMVQCINTKTELEKQPHDHARYLCADEFRGGKHA